MRLNDRHKTCTVNHLKIQNVCTKCYTTIVSIWGKNLDLQFQEFFYCNSVHKYIFVIEYFLSGNMKVQFLNFYKQHNMQGIYVCTNMCPNFKYI